MCLQPVTKKGYRKRNREGKELKGRHPYLVQAPCGKCASCEAKLRNDWAFRMKWESNDHVFSWFILLTYDENNLPWYDKETQEILRGSSIRPVDYPYVSPCVYKRDIQLFIKRIRKRQEKLIQEGTIPEMKLRYYVASEYGELGGRPHYHMVMWSLHPLIRREILNGKYWERGFAMIRPLKTGSDAGFKYLTKYLYKQKQLSRFPVKPFSLMSKIPYIGNRFEKEAKKFMIRNKTFTLPYGEKLEYVPRIYRDKLAPVIQDIANLKRFQNQAVMEEKKLLSDPNYFRNKLQEKNNKQRIYNRELSKL